MKKSAIWINRLLWTAIVTALIVVATYVSLGRYYIGYAEEYQQELVGQFVDFTGLPVEVNRLYGSWSRLSPVLTMEELVLHAPDNPQEPVLTVKDVSFQLDAIGTVISGAIQVQRLSIAGVECSLEEISPGKWQLKGYPSGSSNTTNVDNIIDLILSLDGAALMDAQLTMSFVKGTEALLSVRELSLRHQSSFRRLRVDASFDQSDNPMVAIVEAQGDPRDQDVFSASGYIKLDDIDFSAQLPALKALGVDLQDARVDGEVWMDWQPGAVIALQGGVNIPLLDIAALSGEELDPLKDLTFDFRAEKNAQEHWQLWLPQLSAQWQKEWFSFERLALILNDQQLTIGVPVFDLGKATKQLTTLDLLSSGQIDLLAALDFSGQLQHLQLALPRHSGSAKSAANKVTSQTTVPAFSMRANLDNVALSSWQGAPGATGVSGYIEVTPRKGVVALDSENVALEFPSVYREPLPFNGLTGQVEWTLTEDRVLVDSSPLYITADHGPATGLLDLDLPLKAGAEEPPKMTLTIGLLDTAASYRGRFIPYILNQNFLDWMAGSVPTGHVIDGGFIYRGSLRAGDHQNRTVQLYLNVDETTLDYHDDWPALTDVSALVEISDTDVRVSSSSAKITNLDVSTALVEAKPLATGGMWLTVDAAAQGDASNALKIVNESYIRKIVGGVFQRWQLDGNVEAGIKLGVPLAGSERESEIDVAVALSDSALVIPEYRIQFDQLNGPLNYSSDTGMTSAGLTAQLYDKAVAVKVSAPAANAVLVDIDGRVDMKDVAAWSEQAAMTFVTGETDFSAQVKVVPDGDSEFSVRSELQGVTIDLPAPYEKEPVKPQDFWLSMPLTAELPLLKMGLTGVAELQLQMMKSAVESGLIVLGEATNTTHEDGFIVVTGQASTFSLSQWQPVLARYQQAESEIVKKRLSSAEKDEGSVAESAVENSLSVKVRELELAEFIGFDQRLEQVMVNMVRRQDSWWLSASNSMLTGELIIPDQEHMPLMVTLERLHLPENLIEDGFSSASTDSLSDIKLDLSIEDLKLGKQSYGSLAFNLRSQADGVRFENISGKLRGVNIDKANPATLEWLKTDQGEESRLFGQFTFADLGGVLKQWNYEKIIESDSGSGSIDLSWPGGPTDWQLAASQGPVYLKVRDGRFLKTSDTAAGTLKVVGIVNFTNIIRRLQLDFSDVYQSGISFDRIEGELIFEDSQLTIVDDLVVKTPSSRFHLRGDADLIAKELDMELIATLPVVNNLPWIVALAGGLPTAAGVYVASKIFEDQVDKFASAVYEVKGDWDNPELDFKRVFDDGKKTKKQKLLTDKAVESPVAEEVLP